MKLRLNQVFQCAALIATTFALAPAISHAEPPKKDHPLVGRYEGSELVFTDIKAYDEADLIQGPTKWPQNEPTLRSKGDFSINGDMTVNVIHVEGPISTYQYKLPQGRSLLEVQRSYENSLKAKGFDVVFTCKVVDVSDDGSCFDIESDKKVAYPLLTFRRTLNATNWPVMEIKGWAGTGTPGMYFHFRKGGRYLLAKRDGSDGVAYVSIALSDTSSSNPYISADNLYNAPVADINENTAFIRVVEGKPMETGKIKFVKASEMQQAINDTGRINLYGIQFDFDKDVIKPESQNTIYEMIKLMQGNPQLRLQVVGHTDSQGTESHNLDLSSRRAGAVIRSLVGAGITVDRLRSRGAGSSEPVATNDTDEGRAKNRRVELVRQ